MQELNTRLKSIRILKLGHFYGIIRVWFKTKVHSMYQDGEQYFLKSLNGTPKRKGWGE